MAADFRLWPAGTQGTAIGFPFAGDPKLLAQGWTRRHLADPKRAEESIALYTSLGYEVRAETLTPAAFASQCAACASVACDACVLIYTRKRDAT